MILSSNKINKNIFLSKKDFDFINQYISSDNNVYLSVYKLAPKIYHTSIIIDNIEYSFGFKFYTVYGSNVIQYDGNKLKNNQEN
jgi:hypothetical protein